jgi:hypothetical protein
VCDRGSPWESSARTALSLGRSLRSGRETRYRTVHLAFDILQGAGLAAGVGIRPFLPGLLAGLLATGNAGVDFDHTDYSFLESPAFLVALLAALLLVAFAERRFGADKVDSGPIGAAVAGVSIGLGALLFAGSLADHHHTAWPGLIGGVLCAALAQAAARSLFSRTRARLDEAAKAALPAYAEAAGLVVAGLSVLLPPLSIIALAFLAWLLITGRRREGRKYAGLRVLR